MTVIDLLRRANPEEVARIYNEHYNSGERNDGWGSVDAFTKVLNRLEGTVGIRGGDDQFEVLVDWVDEKWGGPNNDKYHNQYFHVGGRMIREPETRYSLSMTDWGEWREMPVRDVSDKNLSDDEIATHVYYELTWFGMPETMEEARNEIMDQAESIKRDVC